MAVTKEEVVEFISNMTVLELAEFIKELDTDKDGNTGNIISYGKISGLFTDSRFRNGRTPESTPVM